MEIQHLTYTFPHQTTPFFQDLSFNLVSQQVNFLIGANGSGKTTLADLLTGLRQPDHGTLTVPDHALYLNQHLPMLMGVRISDVARLVLGIEYGRPQLTLTDLQPLVDAATFNFLAPIWQQHYGELSGGQRKLVQLLLFLQVDRDFMVLDEPTAEVDREHAQYLFKVMQAHPQRTYLVITHDRRDLAAFNDYQVLWLADHQIKAAMTKQVFEQQPPTASFVQAFQHS